MGIDPIKCWNCGETHKEDCPKPCRYCLTLGKRGMENAKNHELMDYIKFRMSIDKKKIVPNYLGKRQGGGSEPDEGWYSRKKPKQGKDGNKSGKGVKKEGEKKGDESK